MQSRSADFRCGHEQKHAESIAAKNFGIVNRSLFR